MRPVQHPPARFVAGTLQGFQEPRAELRPQGHERRGELWSGRPFLCVQTSDALFNRTLADAIPQPELVFAFRNQGQGFAGSFRGFCERVKGHEHFGRCARLRLWQPIGDVGVEVCAFKGHAAGNVALDADALEDGQGAGFGDEFAEPGQRLFQFGHGQDDFWSHGFFFRCRFEKASRPGSGVDPGRPAGLGWEGLLGIQAASAST